MARRSVQLSLGLLLATLAVIGAGCSKDSPTAPSPTPTPTPTPCSFAVSDGPAASVAATGEEFTISITTTAGCTWAASSSASFISAVGQANGTGNGTVRFAVQSNAGAARQGSVVVASRTLAVSQDAGSPETCDLAVTPTEFSVPKQGSDVAVDVTVNHGTGCTWPAASNDAFITVKSGAAGTGTGQAVLSVAANTGVARVGTATIAGRTVTVLQETAVATTCAFSVSPTQASAGGPGGSIAVTITKTQGTACAWIAQSQSTFLTIQGASAGVDSGSVTILAAPNTGAARSGTVLVAGQTVTVNQSAGATGNPGAVLSFQSDPGDFIGGGQSRSYTLTSSQYQLTLDSTHSQLQFRIPPGTGEYWTLNLSAPLGQPLTPGLYNSAVRLAVLTPGAPGLDFFGNSRGCNQVTGRFLVAEAVYGAGNTVTRFHAKFDQHCEGWSVGLRGEIWIDSQGSTTPPPMADLPDGPASPTTFFSYQSDAGDFIGHGLSETITMATAKFSAWDQPSTPTTSIRLLPPSGGAFNWNLDFEAPSGTQLLPGTYNSATRFPFNAAGVPGLSVSGNGSGCNTLTGSFVVLEATYGAQGEVLRFHATFEQHCEGAVPALRGEIYIVANPWK
jgi:hypothetical protein